MSDFRRPILIQNSIHQELQSKKAKDDELLFAFRKFDLDRDGIITRIELQAGFVKFGRKISLLQADEIIQQVDLSKKGAVTFKDFCVMMQG